jgi:hypothetical protein
MCVTQQGEAEASGRAEPHKEGQRQQAGRGADREDDTGSRGQQDRLSEARVLWFVTRST